MKIQNMFKAMWRGPFFLGQLDGPVTLGVALLKLFDVIWKALIALVLASVAFSVCLSIYLLYESYRENSLISNIKMKVKYDEVICSHEYPLLISLENQTGNTVVKVDFNIESRYQNRSTNLTPFAPMVWDNIVKNSEIGTSCWKVPDEVSSYPKDLSYSAVPKMVNLEN